MEKPINIIHDKNYQSDFDRLMAETAETKYPNWSHLPYRSKRYVACSDLFYSVNTNSPFRSSQSKRSRLRRIMSWHGPHSPHLRCQGLLNCSPDTQCVETGILFYKPIYLLNIPHLCRYWSTHMRPLAGVQAAVRILDGLIHFAYDSKKIIWAHLFFLLGIICTVWMR